MEQSLFLSHSSFHILFLIPMLTGVGSCGLPAGKIDQSSPATCGPPVVLYVVTDAHNAGKCFLQSMCLWWQWSISSTWQPWWVRYKLPLLVSALCPQIWKCDALWSFPPIFAIRGPLTQNFCDMMRLCATYENISLSCLSFSISYCCFGVLPAFPLYCRQEYKNSIKPGKHCKEWVTVSWWPPGEKKA